MLKRLATFFSVLFHPLFFPVYALLFVNWVSPYHMAGVNKPELFRIVIVNTLAFPLLTIFIMKRLEMVKSVFLHDREERIIPLIAISLYYFWTFVVMIRQEDPNPFLITLFLGASISVFACFFFNLFFKISLHTAGAGAFVAITLLLALSSSFNLQVPLMVIIIFAGLVGTSRWYLGGHEGFEIFSGYLVGFFSQLIALQFIT